MYSRYVDALGVPAAETLFIDDSGANVAGAERAGLQAHRHTTVKVLADALERSGLL